MERAKEIQMFQNETIAAQHGATVESELIAAGVQANVAASLGRSAGAVKLKELNDWTVENVGLD